jgi:hypothetical protein
MIICFDIDNVICKTDFNNNYDKSKPNKKVISLINKLYSKGYIIKIFTARYMGRHNENISLVKKKYFKKTELQLRKWNIKYHKLYMGKPNFDIFIDDKSLGFNKNWIKELKFKLKIK